MYSKDITSLEWRARLILFIFFLVAFYSWCKGPISAIKDSRDFAVIYLSSYSWAQGLDPYNQELYYDIWVKADALPDKMPDKNMVPSVYPIISLPLCAPITFLSWPTAKIFWMFLNSLAFFALLALLLIMSKINLRDWRAITLVSFCLMLYPIHVTIAMGQPTILVIACGLGSIMAANSKRHLYSSILLAASLCLKPQLGISFLCYMMILRQWKILWFCLSIIMVIFLAGILRLGLDNFSWVGSWTRNLTTAFTEGGLNDPTMKNQYRHHLLNLQFPLSMMMHSKIVVTILAIAIVVLEITFFMRYVRTDINFDELLTLSFLSIISLFPIYHRYYDASILVLILTTTFMMINTEFYKFSLILICLSIPFLFPWQDIIVNAWNYGLIRYSITNSWWWNIVVLPLQVYCLLIMSLVILNIFVVRNSTLKLKA
jgi:hypothetical protein